MTKGDSLPKCRLKNRYEFNLNPQSAELCLRVKCFMAMRFRNFRAQFGPIMAANSPINMSLSEQGQIQAVVMEGLFMSNKMKNTYNPIHQTHICYILLPH